MEANWQTRRKLFGWTWIQPRSNSRRLLNSMPISARTNLLPTILYLILDRFNDMETDTNYADDAADLLVIDGDLTAAVAARQAGDLANTQALTAASNRAQAATGAIDTKLDGAIADRISGDTANSDALAVVVAARGQDIADAAAARVAAVVGIQTQLNNLLSADTSTLQNLAGVVAAYQASDGTLQGTFDLLAARVTAAENVGNSFLEAGL